jgi:hypothetical protein
MCTLPTTDVNKVLELLGIVTHNSETWTR